ncbi:hypothetical protein ABBQ32_000021 [Trebouxia sp. C0010 RCD-2024]
MNLCCLQDTTQVGRSGPGSNLSTHMTQEVLVAHPSTTKLNLRWCGPNPVRYFEPIKEGVDLDDTITDGGGYLRDDVGARVNICQKPLLQVKQRRLQVATRQEGVFIFEQRIQNMRHCSTPAAAMGGTEGRLAHASRPGSQCCWPFVWLAFVVLLAREPVGVFGQNQPS